MLQPVWNWEAPWPCICQTRVGDATRLARPCTGQYPEERGTCKRWQAVQIAEIADNTKAFGGFRGRCKGLA